MSGFVAVGPSGKIATSADGITWVERTSNTTETLQGAGFGNALHVAVGTSGEIVTSGNGIDWTVRSTPTSAFLRAVTYRPGLFVAVGDGGTILTSPDGVTWTERTSGTGNSLRGVATNGSLFVAVGLSGTNAYVLTSADGIGWTSRSVAGGFLQGVTYAEGLFVAVGFSGNVRTSPDGLTWTSRSAGTTDSLVSVAWGEGIFVAVGANYRACTSLDGITWSAGKTVNSSGTTLNASAHDGETFLAAGQFSACYTSPDAATWTQRTIGFAPNAAIAWVQNTAPNAPAWTTPDNQTVAANEANTLSWAFSDPDPGDTQSAYNLKRWALDTSGARVGTPVTTYAATPLSQHTIPAGTLTAGTRYEFQVDTFDSQGVEGPYSASLFLTAGTRPSAPTWLDPTNGQTIATGDYTGTISAPNVDASEWTLYADNAGSIDTATILQGPVTKTTGDLRSHTWAGLANNTTVWWSVRIKDGGLWSQPAQIRTPVSYTPPADPTATLSTDPNTGALLVAITNPAPGAGEPAVAYNEVTADDGDGKGFEARFGSAMVTPNSTWVYYLARGDRDYSGNIQVTAVGTNGTRTTVTA